MLDGFRISPPLVEFGGKVSWLSLLLITCLSEGRSLGGPFSLNGLTSQWPTYMAVSLLMACSFDILFMMACLIDHQLPWWPAFLMTCHKRIRPWPTTSSLDDMHSLWPILFKASTLQSLQSVENVLCSRALQNQFPFCNIFVFFQVVLLVWASSAGVCPEGLGREECGSWTGGVPQVSKKLASACWYFWPALWSSSDTVIHVVFLTGFVKHCPSNPPPLPSMVWISILFTRILIVCKGGGGREYGVKGEGEEYGVKAQSKEVTRGPPELVQHFHRGSSHRRSGAACPKLLRFG